MMKVCPICGRNRVIFWPEHWVYRRGSTYYCSENCMDISIIRDTKLLNEIGSRRRKEIIMATKVTLEQKKKAVEIAVSGGNPLDYLRELGSNRPDGLWYTIKENLKKVDPETYEKLPDYRGKTRTAKSQEQIPTVKVDGPLKIETKEPEKVEVVQAEPKKVTPLQFDGYTVRCIEGQYGKFYWDYEYNRLDWTSPEGEEVSLSPEGWKKFCTEIMPKVMAILGVSL